MQKKYKKIIFLILIIFLIFCIFAFFHVKKISIDSFVTIKNTTENKNQIPIGKEIPTTLEINNTKYKKKINSKITVYEFMKKIENDGKINFKEKNYIGMGRFIEEINGIRMTKEKYWIYYVNNKKANIGISNYKINPGDKISWKYESQY